MLFFVDLACDVTHTHVYLMCVLSGCVCTRLTVLLFRQAALVAKGFGKFYPGLRRQFIHHYPSTTKKKR
jgi:hypothetical protein